MLLYVYTGATQMNVIDEKFYGLMKEISGLSEKELYHRIRKEYDKVPLETRRSCMNFFNKFGYWGRLEEDKGIFEEIELKAAALGRHTEDFVWLYERLCDYRSKKTLYAVLNNWYSYDFASTSQAKEYMFDAYFDLDLIPECKNETIAELGAFTGDTVQSFVANYGADCYKKIYCYEITPSTFEKLEKNLSGYKNIVCRLAGVSDSAGAASLGKSAGGDSANALADGGNEVIVTTLDDDIKEPLTMIIADIEGGERKALVGARGHILRDRPKMLWSVYHNNEDIYGIAQAVCGMRDDYKFYLRYKSSPIYPTEITLYCL